MRVAVTCDDLTTVAGHLGRAPLFLIYDVTDGKPVLKQQRLNQHAGHSQPCGGAPGPAKPHRDHADVLAAVSDCAIVVARGMGKRLAADFEARGIKAAIIDRDILPFEAAALAVSGECLKAGGFCECEGA